MTSSAFAIVLTPSPCYACRLIDGLEEKHFGKAENMTAKPNILFIILDTQRRDRLSLYGHRAETSPYLDSFAQKATVFERAIAPAQWTIPAHGSMFTGVYPSTHMLTQAFQQLSLSHPTLAEILRVDDYHTAAFCNNPLLGLLNHGLQRGFTEFYNYAGATPNRPVDLTRSAVRRKMATWLRQFARYVTNQFATSNTLFNGAVNPLVVPIWTRLVNFKGDSERSINDLIDYWADYHAGGNDKPLFAFLNLMGTHTPYYPSAQSLDHVAPKLRNNSHVTKFITKFNASAAEWLSPVNQPLEDWQHEAIKSYYDAEIASQDTHLGKLFDYLEKSGALENTMVIIAADHGEGHGDHGFQGHSFVVYQELVHVPMMIYYPEHFPAGKKVSTNVSTRRLFHTILDVTKTQAPLAEDDPNADIESLSLVASLNGKPDTERGIAFAEAFPPLNLVNVIERRNPSMLDTLKLTTVRRGIYEGDHKLALVGDKTESFFDVANDPAEESDLSQKHPEKVAHLQKKISSFVKEAQSQRIGNIENGDVSDEIIDNLRALGYFE